MRIIDRLLVPCAVMALVGCSTVDDYRTEADEVYRGQAIGRNEPGCTVEPCSFVRRGFPEGLSVDVAFAPLDAEPGRITSDEGACGRFFDGDPFQPITALAHDDLSLFEFPGARLKNYIYTVHPQSGPLAGRDLMTFVSLREDGSLEVRVIGGSGSNTCAPDDCEAFARGECDVFGIFPVTKESL